MNGRKEHEEQIKNKIENKIDNAPEYIKEYYYSLGKKTATTQSGYINATYHFLTYLMDNTDIDIAEPYNLKEVKPSTIDQYFYSLNDKSSSYKARTYYSLKKFFNFLENNDYIEKNPINKIEPYRDTDHHEITYLTQEEIEIVKNNVLNDIEGKEQYKKDVWKYRDYAIVMLGLTNALRVTSITEININDINFEEHSIKIIEKGNVYREIYCISKTFDAIMDWIEVRKQILGDEKVDALFISNRHKRIGATTIRDMIKKYTYNIDKKITPHKLRSTFATMYLEKTGDIMATAYAMGHASVNSTKRYANKPREINEEEILKNIEDLF